MLIPPRAALAQAEGLNGHPTVRFPPSSAFVTTANLRHLLDNEAGYTIVSLARYVLVPDQHRIEPCERLPLDSCTRPSSWLPGDDLSL